MMLKMLVLVTAFVPVGLAVAQDEPEEYTPPPQETFVPDVCADLTATPVRLPNGDDQYPTIPCKTLDFTTPPPDYQPQEAVSSTEPAAPQPPKTQPPLLDDLEQGTVPQPQTEDEQIDYNNLQMRRLGDMDARQGRPINMNYGGNLYYLQGYTAGQKARMNAPAPGGFGGVSGFGR